MKPFTLLIVDDEPIILKSYSRLLQLQLPGINIFVAKNGIEGLALIKEKSPNFILLDLAMPEMNGFEVLAQLQEDHVKLPIIVMTAFDTEDNIELAKMISQNNHIQVLRKPIDVQVLIERLSRAISEVNRDE